MSEHAVLELHHSGLWEEESVASGEIIRYEKVVRFSQCDAGSEYVLQPRLLVTDLKSRRNLSFSEESDLSCDDVLERSSQKSKADVSNNGRVNTCRIFTATHRAQLASTRDASVCKASARYQWRPAARSRSAQLQGRGDCEHLWKFRFWLL